MPSLDRPQAPDPYALLPQVPAFALTSDTFAADARVPDETTNTPVGRSRSPHLAWSGFPEQTSSFAVTCFDPDAPGPSGWWHWTLLDLPPTITELAAGAGALGSDLLPSTAVTLRGDDGIAAYVGAAPPPGDREHRYFYAVHALDVPSMGLEADVMPGAANMMLTFHTIARAVLVGTFQR
ncbi:MAG: YbhB/YbcL family Raf kinase inhibitor-like protein [Cellulomonas sp.]|jgi:Raf kinase inhibitor-like YbhB/YbcL family protein|nr:YbhB/YbcL family Raf kinase inhibitor-like protein [Cellulomonas sp.]